MNRPLIIGVMGGGNATEAHVAAAYQLGALIAQKGWVLLNGGRNSGIMAASAKGAADHAGLTIGVLPDGDASQAAEHIRIPICTGMGSGRNIINVLSSDVVVACPGGPGTISEIALAIKHGKQVITLNFDPGSGFQTALENGRLIIAESAEEVIRMIERCSTKLNPQQ